MAQNVVISIYEVESDAYHEFANLKLYPENEDSVLSQDALVTKENGSLRLVESFDHGMDTIDDTVIAGLVGALFGIIGGPLGVLLGGSYGALIGSTIDVGDALDDASMLEQIAKKMVEGETAIICLTDEEDESILDAELGQYKAIIARFDAAVVAEEIEEAQDLEHEMARLARKELKAEKKAERKQNIEEKRAKLNASFDAFKAKFKRDSAEE